jgi:DNA transposition AAA+ family ATPase
MTVQPQPSRFAALQNVAGLLGLVNRLQGRSVDLPGFGVFHGPSGFGKTKAAIYACNKTSAPMVSIGHSWTQKKFLQHVLIECGCTKPRGTVADLAEQAIDLLGSQVDRPLIIDEADLAVDRGWIELIRELHDYSQVPVILIGEEMLPAKLQRVERVHNRVLDWVAAAPCNLDDARKLAAAYAAGVEIDDALLEMTRRNCSGIARRIATTLDEMVEFARAGGHKRLTAEIYTGRFMTGEPPKRLRAVA